jgi:hypothetical protein
MVVMVVGSSLLSIDVSRGGADRRRAMQSLRPPSSGRPFAGVGEGSRVTRETGPDGAASDRGDRRFVAREKVEPRPHRHA